MALSRAANRLRTEARHRATPTSTSATNLDSCVSSAILTAISGFGGASVRTAPGGVRIRRFIR